MNIFEQLIRILKTLDGTFYLVARRPIHIYVYIYIYRERERERGRLATGQNLPTITSISVSRICFVMHVF